MLISSGIIPGLTAALSLQNHFTRPGSQRGRIARVGQPSSGWYLRSMKIRNFTFVNVLGGSITSCSWQRRQNDPRLCRSQPSLRQPASRRWPSSRWPPRGTVVVSFRSPWQRLSCPYSRTRQRSYGLARLSGSGKWAGLVRLRSSII